MVQASLAFAVAACAGAHAQSAPAGAPGGDAPVFHVSAYRPISPRVTQADAAFRAASAWVHAHGAGAVLDLGASRWDVCNDGQGWVLPQAPAHSGGLSIVGTNVQDSQLVLTCPVHRDAPPPGLTGELSQAFLWQPTVRPGQLNAYRMHDFTLDVQGNAESCMDMLGLVYVSSFSNITCSGASGPDHGIRFGDHRFMADAWSFQTFLSNVETTPGAEQGSHGKARADIVDGKIQVSLEDGGSGYSHATRAWLLGYGAGTEPCTVTPELAVTVADEQGSGGRGRISGIRVLGASAGCSGKAWIAIYDPVYPVRYGILLDNWTDSSAYDLQPDSGYEAALWLNSSSDVMVHAHPCCGMPVQIRDSGTNTWIGTELDSPAHYGFLFDHAASPSLFGTNFFWNDSLAGSSGYFFGPDVKIATISGGNCTNLQDAGGYHQFVFPEGPLGANDAGGKKVEAPYGLSAYGERPCASGAPGTDLVARPASIGGKGQPAPQPVLLDTTVAVPADRARLAAGACVRVDHELPRPAAPLNAEVTPESYPGDSFTWDVFSTSSRVVTLRVCNRSNVMQTLTSRIFRLYIAGK